MASCNNLHYLNSKAQHVRAGRTLAIAALFIECSIGQNIVDVIYFFEDFRICAGPVIQQSSSTHQRIIFCFLPLSPHRIAIHFLAPVSSYLNNTYITLLSTRTTNT